MCTKTGFCEAYKQYEASPKTATSRVCAACTSCPAGKLRANCTDGVRNSVCTACPAGKFSAVADAPSCVAWTPVCGAGFQEATPPSATSDRVCAPLSIVLRLVMPAFIVMERRAVAVDLTTLVIQKKTTAIVLFYT